MSEPFLRTPFSFQKEKVFHPKKKTPGMQSLRKVLGGKFLSPRAFFLKKGLYDEDLEC